MVQLSRTWEGGLPGRGQCWEGAEEGGGAAEEEVDGRRVDRLRLCATQLAPRSLGRGGACLR